MANFICISATPSTSAGCQALTQDWIAFGQDAAASRGRRQGYLHLNNAGPGKCIVYGQLAKPVGIFMESGVRVLYYIICALHIS